MLKRISLVTALVMSAGCATQMSVHNPEGKPASDLARVASQKHAAWLGKYDMISSITTVLNDKGQTVADSTFFAGSPKEVSVPEGKYFFLIKCEARGLYNFQRVTVDLKAGESYTAYCLGHYRPAAFGDHLEGALGFISSNENWHEERKAAQALVDHVVSQKYQKGTEK